MSRDLHWVSLRDLHYSDVCIHIYIHSHTCDMFHLHDVSRRRHVGCCGITRALRVQQLWHIINLLWLPNAIRGIHYPATRDALTIALFKKMHLAINSFDAIRHVRSVSLAPFHRDDQSVGNCDWKRSTLDMRNSALARPKFAILYCNIFIPFITFHRSKSRISICGNLKLPYINHELSNGSASADIQWFFLTREPPSGFSPRSYDEDLNFAVADSDLHQRNRSNRSRSKRNGRAPVRRERIRNVNVCMGGISRRRLYIMQIPGQELLPDTARARLARCILFHAWSVWW